MQGFVTKLSVRRLSSGAVSPGPSRCARLTTNTATRRHSIGSFEPLVPRRRHSISGLPSLFNTEVHHSNFQPTLLSRGNELFGSWNAHPSFPREITWLAGAPGAGKGTNSAVVASARGYDAPTIVVSSLLESPECKRIKDAGGMVDDDFVFNELLKELAKPEYRNGVVVDGFPRTEKQAAMISELHDSVSSSTSFNFVTLFVDEQESVKRQLSRGESIRKLNLVRKAAGMELLEERATDVCEDAARLRYTNFKTQYDAVNKLSARFPLSIIDASSTIETVRLRLHEACARSFNSVSEPAGRFSSLKAQQLKSEWAYA